MGILDLVLIDGTFVLVLWRYEREWLPCRVAVRTLLLLRKLRALEKSELSPDPSRLAVLTTSSSLTGSRRSASDRERLRVSTYSEAGCGSGR